MRCVASEERGVHPAAASRAQWFIACVGALETMRVANGSQPFRRDPEGTLESEPFLFQQREAEISDHHHDHPPPEELSVHRIQVLARRFAFPFARRIPRVTKRYFRLCFFAIKCQ